jgi:hypothetical protein
VDDPLGIRRDNSPDLSNELGLSVDSDLSEKRRDLDFVPATSGQIVDHES